MKTVSLYLDGSETDLKKLLNLYHADELKDIIGYKILNMQECFSNTSPIVNLVQWLQGQFTDSFKQGWQTLEEIFRQPIPAFMSGFRSGVVIKRAKCIQLDDVQTVVLIIKLEKLENKQLKLIFHVTVTDEPNAPTCLPPTLKLTVADQTANVLEVAAGEDDDYLEQEWLFEMGEQFRVTLALNDIEITEDFAV